MLMPWTTSEMADCASIPAKKLQQSFFTCFKISPKHDCAIYSVSFASYCKMSMITATTWVPRGYAAQLPNRYKFDEEEYERIAKLAKLELDDAKEDLEEAQQAQNGTSKSSNNGTETIDNAAEEEEADLEKDEDGDVYDHLSPYEGVND